MGKMGTGLKFLMGIGMGGNEVIEMGGIWDETSIPAAHVYC